MKKQDKLIHQQDKWIREQRQQHSQIQDKVASLEDQSQQIAGETLEILFESQSYYILVLYSLKCLCLIFMIFNSYINSWFLLLFNFWIILSKYIP